MLVAMFVVPLLGLGWLITGALAPELDALERLGLAYGIGAGTFTLCVFLASLAGIPINLASGLILYSLLLVISAFCSRRYFRIRSRNTRVPHLSVVQIAITALIGIVLLLTFAVAAYWPPYVWDSLAVWALKGQVIAATGTLAELPRTGWPFYPLNISLQIAFLYLLGGDFLQSIFPLYLLSLAAMLIANLRVRAGLTTALACALFLISTPIVRFQAAIAYADLPFAFYYVGSAIYLYRWLSERKPAWLVISALLLGFAAWTRTEGPLYLAINAVTLLLFTRPLRTTLTQAAAYTGIFLLMWLPWTIYVRLANYGDYFGYAPIGLSDAISGHLDLTRLGTILNFLGQRTVALSDWSLLWVALPIALLLGMKAWRMHLPIIALVVLNLLAMIYSYYVATAQTYFSVEWWLRTGFDRMTLHWIPLTAFYLGEAIAAAKVFPVEESGLDMKNYEEIVNLPFEKN